MFSCHLQVIMSVSSAESAGEFFARVREAVGANRNMVVDYSV